MKKDINRYNQKEAIEELSISSPFTFDEIAKFQEEFGLTNDQLKKAVSIAMDSGQPLSNIAALLKAFQIPTPVQGDFKEGGHTNYPTMNNTGISCVPNEKVIRKANK